jgi:hypothetical protein
MRTTANRCMRCSEVSDILRHGYCLACFAIVAPWADNFVLCVAMVADPDVGPFVLTVAAECFARHGAAPPSGIPIGRGRPGERRSRR